MMDKSAVRRDCRERVRSLDKSAQDSHSASIREFLRESATFVGASSVFSYAPLFGEPDLLPLFQSHSEKLWAFPRVEAETSLSFLPVSTPGQLSPGSYGILEPEPLPSREDFMVVPDLILVPGLGFDPSTMARLGRGKGYYDRALGRILLAAPARPLLIGVCFSVQLANIPAHPHDIPMDKIVTESGWIDLPPL